MRRLAAVDIGSNTVHALVADEDGGRLTDVAHYVEMPELGAQVARTGRIGARKQREALAALASVVARAGAHDFEELVAGATAAVRRAADGTELLERASAQLGTPVRLISEQREAELSFEGVASRHAGAHGWVMCDLGGGSTELVAADGGRIERWASIPVGSGSYADRFLGDPPRPAQRAALRRAALAELHTAPDSEAQRLVATGGTASNLGRVLSRRNPPQLLTSIDLLAAEERLDSAPAARLAQAWGLPAARIRALRGGVEVLLLLLDFYGVDSVHVSHEGLRHGMLLAYAESQEDWYLSRNPAIAGGAIGPSGHS